MDGFMSVLVNSNAEAEQLDQTHAQHTRLKPPGAMGAQILINVDFDASLDVLFDRELGPAMFTKP